jgi:hypothetical protein
MDTTLTYAGIAIVAVIALVVFLFIAKRILRVAVRLMFVGVVILALLAAGGWAWWNGWFDSKAAPTPARPAATPHRTPR